MLGTEEYRLGVGLLEGLVVVVWNLMNLEETDTDERLTMGVRQCGSNRTYEVGQTSERFGGGLLFLHLFIRPLSLTLALTHSHSRFEPWS